MNTTLPYRSSLPSLLAVLPALLLDGFLAVLVLVKLEHGEVEEQCLLDNCGDGSVKRWRDGEEDGGAVEVGLPTRVSTMLDEMD